MSAQPVHDATPPRIPCTIRSIREHLPEVQRTRFEEEIAGVNLEDFAAVARVRDKWWGRAVFWTDPSIAEDFAKLGRGELELVPSPFAR